VDDEKNEDIPLRGGEERKIKTCIWKKDEKSLSKG